MSRDQERVELPDGVADTFTHLCKVCGVTVNVVNGKAQPHRCRIELKGPKWTSE